MKPGVPWSVKGIEPQAREAAKDAARRAGMTVGEWLNQMIFTAGDPETEAVEEERVAAIGGGRAASAFSVRSGPVARMTVAAGARESAAERDANFYAALESLGRRLEKAEHTSTIALSAIDRSIETALSRLESLEQSNRTEGRDRGETLRALEATRRALEARVDRLEQAEPSERRTAALKGLESLVEQMARTIDRRQNLADDRLGAVESAADEARRRTALIEKSMSDDRERIDAVEEAIAADRDHVEAVEDAVAAGLQRVQSVEETMAADREQNRSRHIEQAAAVSQLRQAVDAIDARSARAEAASRAAVASLEETLAHLEGRIDSKDEAFEDFVGKTEARLRALGDELKRGDDRIAELNASIDDMSAHIEAAEKRSADGINKVSDFVSRLGEKLEETEDRLGGAGELASVAARDAMRDVEAKIAAAQAETDDKLSPVKLTMSHLAERLEEIERRAEEQEEAWRQRDEAQSRFQQVNAPLPLAGDVVSDAAARGGEAADLDIPPVGGEPASQSPFDRSWSAPDTDDIEDAPQGALAEDADLGGFDEAPEAVVEIDYGDAGEPEDLSADPFEDQFALLDDSEAETPEDALWEDELNSPSLADHDNQDAAGFPRRDEGLDVSLDIDETLEADDGDLGDEDDDLFGAEDPFAIAMDEADAAEIEDLPDADEPLATVGPEEGALVAVSSDDLDLELGEELDEELSDQQTASSYLDAARRAAQAAADASGRGDKYRALNVDPDDPIGEPRRGGAPGRVALIGAALLAFVALAVGGRILLKSPGGEAPINVSPASLTPAAPASLGAPPETAPSPLTSLDAAQERQAALEGAAVQGGVNGPEQISAETPADATPSPRVDESQPAAGSDDAGFAAAAQDDREPAVLYQAALAALEGLGRDVDRQEGVELLKRAAYQSHPPAQFRLGQIYETGRGAPADAAAARRWYERAAFSSNRNAMHNLAVLYARGEGGQQDYAEAARWFEKAANSGLPDSQFNLGVLYEQGRGVNQDHGTAYVWYTIAARSGDRDAELRAEAMTTHLSPARLAEAKTAADGWRAEPLDPQANGLQVADAAPTKAMIAEAQRLLNALGFDAGPADGVIGPRTVTAIRSFETGAGLTSTGRVSTGLLEALRTAS